MIVIIEGVDGVGKTTLCQQIVEKYNYEYIKESYTDDCKEKEHRITLMLQRLFLKKNYIYDRTTLIDDFVYSFLNQTESTLSEYFDIITNLLDRCQIIHLYLDEKIRSKRLNERGDQYITNDQIEQIAENYERFYNYLDNVQYVELSGNLEKDVEKVMEVINNEN